MIKLRVTWDTSKEKEIAESVFNAAASIIDGKAELLGVHRDSEHHFGGESELRLKTTR